MQSAFRGTSPAVRITLAAVIIMSMACTPRQESAEYHYMSPEDEQAVVLMVDDEQGKVAVVALKDMMVDMNGFEARDNYAEPQELTSAALPSISMPQQSREQLLGAAGDAPVDEPAEVTVAVVVPAPVTPAARSQQSISLSVASVSNQGESQSQLVSAMNIIASMATGASAQPVVASLSQVNRPAPTPVTSSQPTTVAPTSTPAPATPDETNVKLAQALKDILNTPPAVTPTVAPDNENTRKSTDSDDDEKEDRRNSGKRKGHKTDDPAEDDVTPTPTAEPTPGPTAKPTAQPSPEPTVGNDGDKKDNDKSKNKK